MRRTVSFCWTKTERSDHLTEAGFELGPGIDPSVAIRASRKERWNLMSSRSVENPRTALIVLGAAVAALVLTVLVLLKYAAELH